MNHLLHTLHTWTVSFLCHMQRIVVRHKKIIENGVFSQQDLHHEDQTRLPVQQIWLLQWFFWVPSSCPRDYSQVSEVSLPKCSVSTSVGLQILSKFKPRLLLCEITLTKKPTSLRYFNLVLYIVSVICMIQFTILFFPQKSLDRYCCHCKYMSAEKHFFSVIKLV